MSPVLVTGGSGYVGTQLIAALLRDGTGVRTTVRSLDREAGLRKAVRRGGADDAGLEVVTADLMADDGWPGAVADCADIYHVASPMIQPKDPDEVIAPAREGTLRVLRAARDAGARRVVLTSSFAAVGYTPKPSADYTEADWTDPDTPGLPPYPRSKAIAERAAWDFIEREGGGTELVSVNPTGIFGPSLVTEVRSTLQLIKAMLDGTMTVVPRQRFGVADVRDVADAHIKAMATPAAAGQRFLVLADGPTISWLQLAQILRDRLGPLAERVPTEEAPGAELPNLVIHNERAKRVLGWRPRPAETTIVETAESLRDLGLLERQLSPGCCGPRRLVLLTTTTNCGGTTRSCAGHMASSLVSVSLTSVAGAGRRPVRSRAWPRQAVRSGSTSLCLPSSGHASLPRRRGYATSPSSRPTRRSTAFRGSVSTWRSAGSARCSSPSRWPRSPTSDGRCARPGAW